MPSYTIYEKPGLPAEDAIDSAVLVKNHYSMLAFFLPFVWMLFKRLWWVLLAYVILLVPISLLEQALPVWSGMVMTLLISLYVALEAPTLIGWSLERKGYVEVGSVLAEDRDHCERRYVEARLAASLAAPLTVTMRPERPAPQSRKFVSVANQGRDPNRDSIIGLFPAPGQPQEKR